MQPSKSLQNTNTNLHMETRRKKSTSGDGFSFPSTPFPENHHRRGSSSDFEFGSITPDSPFSNDPCKNSPADHLFFNGRLLPHAFPFQPTSGAIYGLESENSRAMLTSRTSSTSSKDSLMSSRSNSTNSRSSSCSSSARTSSSDNSERRLLYRQSSKTTSVMGRDQRYGGGTNTGSKAVSAQVYGSSQRWQFMAPVPALSRETSLRRKKAAEVSGNNSKNHDEDRRSLPKKKNRTAVVKRLRFGRRVFRWFLAACKECHAIEPSKKKNVRNVKLK
ncbi:uncharacterized protein LOC133793719 [Humulus lupulus]|uniref:uncharacterized protein LOC133793719 n=1 Tax=Humulus lupulus TaxID=3486 RepID=UPI002B4044B2|nr:uncharacterized protein LOC133793719 [Humulus lupulus]